MTYGIIKKKGVNKMNEISKWVAKARIREKRIREKMLKIYDYTASINHMLTEIEEEKREIYRYLELICRANTEKDGE